MNFKKIILAGIAQGFIVIAFSLFFNVFLFGSYNEEITVSRPETSSFMTVGLPITTLVWGIAISFAYHFFNSALSGSYISKGFKFGLVFWATSASFLEVFNYLIYDFPFMAIISGLLCYFFALTLGGITIAKIQSDT